MKLKLLILTGLLMLTFKDTPSEPINHPPVHKTIKVDSNPNIHTSHIIELFIWPGEYPTRPMIVKAQEYFKDFADHPAIQLSDSLLLNEIFYFDELSEILLYIDALPKKSFKHSIEGTPYADREDIILEWVSLIADFYVDADVEGFLSENRNFYEGANLEVVKNLPPANFVALIENYYRAEKWSYTIIPAPEMPTGGEYGTRGIGPYIRTSDGMAIYQIISASLPVETKKQLSMYEEFGFDNRENTLRMSYHEFGHAFVNPLFEINEDLIKLVSHSEHLFTEEYKTVMSSQNYSEWLTVVMEYLVRLGEIRLAERSGDKAWAEDLRRYHIDELKFVLLPELEKKIILYENDPELGTFKDYLPELLSVFTTFNTTDLHALLNR